jgi:hypothetical protein
MPIAFARPAAEVNRFMMTDRDTADTTAPPNPPQAADGLSPCSFVLQHVPMFGKLAVLDPDHLRGDPGFPLIS